MFLFFLFFGFGRVFVGIEEFVYAQGNLSAVFLPFDKLNFIYFECFGLGGVEADIVNIFTGKFATGFSDNQPIGNLMFFASG